MRNSMSPHVSPALTRLGGGATVASVFVGACLVLQMLVFGFLHFTDARFEPAPVEAEKPKVVVSKGPDAKPDTTPAELVPRVPSRWDGVMRNFANVGAWVGATSAIILLAQLTLGVIVGASAGLPEIGKVVSAFHWGLLVVLLAVPMQNLVPAFPTVGVFVGYDTMAGASERAVASGGDPMLIVSLVVVPFIGLFALIALQVKFRAGVHSGVVVRSVSQLDTRIEEELARVRAEGVGSNIGPRAVGVVGAPVGYQPTGTADPMAAATLKQDVDDLMRGGSRRPI
jgi:hypothetical protein